MMKLLLTSLIVYTLYKYFLKPQLAVPPRSQESSQAFSNPNEAPKESDEGEYIDYEEIK